MALLYQCDACKAQRTRPIDRMLITLRAVDVPYEHAYEGPARHLCSSCTTKITKALKDLDDLIKGGKL